MGGGQSVSSTRDYGEGQRRIPRKKSFCQGTKDMPERRAGEGSPPSNTLLPLHRGGRPELMGAHHSRRDNCRVAWQEGSVRKAWPPENCPVAEPGWPPTRESRESAFTQQTLAGAGTLGIAMQRLFPQQSPTLALFPHFCETHLWSDPALTSHTH